MMANTKKTLIASSWNTSKHYNARSTGKLSYLMDKKRTLRSCSCLWCRNQLSSQNPSAVSPHKAACSTPIWPKEPLASIIKLRELVYSSSPLGFWIWEFTMASSRFHQWSKTYEASNYPIHLKVCPPYHCHHWYVLSQESSFRMTQ